MEQVANSALLRAVSLLRTDGPRNDGPRNDSLRNDGLCNDGPRNDGLHNDSVCNDGKTKQADGSSAAARQTRTSGRTIPCSAGQKRFWALDQLEPGNPSLHIAVRWRLEGRLDKGCLERAIANIVARHAILRTFFVEEAGEPVQRIEDELPFRIDWALFDTLLEADALNEAERLAIRQARLPFDLHGPSPLLRVTAVVISDVVTVLNIVVHHIVCDGWSLGILAREIGTEYAALCADGMGTPAASSPDFGDYCRMQADSSAFAVQIDDDRYWRTTLDGMKHFEVLPDKSRPPVLSNNGKIVSRLLPRDLTNRLAALGRREGCTMFATALSVLLALLHRYSGETDIGIGTQTAGRDRVEFENVVGLLINTLVLRNDLSGNPSFLEVMARVRDSAADAFEHASMPLERLIEILRPPRDRSRNPLFSVNFVVQRSFIRNEDYGSLRLVDLPSVSAGAIYEMNFFLVERPEGWRLSCEFNTDLYQTETIERLLSHYEHLAQSVVVDPLQRLTALSLIDKSEERLLLRDWLGPVTTYPRESTVIDLFRNQAAAFPDAIAVLCGNRSASYRQLDAASDRLAAQLNRLDLRPGRSVGVMLRRSIELLVALLAVHKAGFAYVPLDPEYPVDRLTHILEDVGLVAVILDHDPDPALPLHDVPQIRLRSGAALIANISRILLPNISSPSDVAYTIYTSGSTGRPKGVDISHRALVNLLASMARCPGLVRSDVLLAVTTVSFDIAGLELFLPLIVGARVVVAAEGDVVDGRRLTDLIRRHAVTVMQATPATWQLLLESGFRSWPGFKMMVGGEGLPRALADRLLDGGGELWNMYGPTETTIWSSCQRIEPGNGVISVGRPIANTQFYVLDAEDKLAPLGVPGHLHIGGDGVALGYHNKPALTAEKFIANRFGSGRLYRTGDVARWLANGELQILGRLDNQIKLRGFRIEPGDIESVLMQHPDVVEAVVVLGTMPSGGAALCAYVVARRSFRARTEDLIASLKESADRALPGYMRPTSITVLEQMPRTQNGKVDRKALPQPRALGIDPDASAIALSPIEQRLAAVWTSVLGVPIAHGRANFFEMGGHSLLAARLLVGIDKEFGRRFSLANLFKAPLLCEQARLLGLNDMREYDFRQVVRLQAGGSRQPLIAINNTGIYYNISKHLAPDHPFTTLQLFDPEMPAKATPTRFVDIASGYVELIRRVQPQGPYALLGWCVAGSLAFEIARQLNDAGLEVAQLILVDTYAPGHMKRLGALHRRLADYSYRWKLIALDWRRLRAKGQGLRVFLANRETIKRIRERFHLPWLAPQSTSTESSSRLELYDQWLLKLLRDAAEQYEPRAYAGRLTLFRSADEPCGRFLDREMGWGRFALGGIDVNVIEGDHFSIFQGAGARQIADKIIADGEKTGAASPASKTLPPSAARLSVCEP